MSVIKSFSQLKKTNSVKDLQEKLKRTTGANKKDYSDDRYWSATQDKSGNGKAVIRFLPPPIGEDVPFVKLFSYGFKGPGGWFIENCPTTIGLPSPVVEANNILWDSKNEDLQKVARGRKRKLSYISNIYVVSDPEHPENEGKVFLFKYGQKIHEKIQNMLVPQFEEDEVINVFDLWKGANFKLRMTRKDGFANFDASVFDAPSELFPKEDDSKYEAVWNAEYSLSAEIGPDKFKSYDALKTKFDRVTAGKQQQTVEHNIPSQDADDGNAINEGDLESIDIDEDDLESFKALID